MKNIRLALFNIRKHKSESVSMIILLMLCMLLLASGASNLIDIQGIFGRTVEKLNGIHNYIQMNNNDYHDFYNDYFLENDEVTRFEQIEGAYTIASKFIDKKGEESTQYMCFINRANEEKMEEFIPDTSLSDEEVAAMEHPVYFPYYVKDTLGFSEGDEFIIILNGKQYPLRIAGFFESCLYADNTYSLKVVVSDEDYLVFRGLTDKAVLLGFDTTDDDNSNAFCSAFLDYVDENTSSGERMGMQVLSYQDLQLVSGEYVKIILMLMIIMSALVLVSVLIMIRHQISDSIKEQVVSIGVLEALGYKSLDISMSYVAEYTMLGLAGVVLGGIFSKILNPVIFRIGEIMSGHHGQMQGHLLLNTGFGIILIAFIVGVSLSRAGMIKKFPPVMAFRKGMSDHHYKKTILPLENTKLNVHLRLSMKGVLGNARSNIGVGICIAVSTFAIVSCFIFYSFFSDGVNALNALMGMEIPDLRVIVTDDTDAASMREDLLADDRVDKILLSDDWFNLKLMYGDLQLTPLAYEDYENTESIVPQEGRLPKHDNEIMITGLVSEEFGKSVGDAITLKLGRVEKEYLICAVVTSLANGGTNIYMTDDGLRRMLPSYKANALEIFLKDGVSYKDYDAYLANSYGRSISDAMEDDGEVSDIRERIQKEAEKAMARLMALYGISHVEYAVNVGGQEISGSSSIFKIKSSISLNEILVTQTGGAIAAMKTVAGIFMAIAVIVIMIIILMLMTSSVKKQRSELGIFKAMGYTSNELMLQLAFRIVPVMVVGVLAGTIAGIIGVGAFVSVFGRIEYNFAQVLAVDTAVILFAFATAYIGAGRIRKISVYELMSE